LTGCGYVGDPQPPLVNIPATVDDLTAVQRGDKISVAFSIPKLTTEGMEIRKPVAIEIRAGNEGGSPFSVHAWAATAKEIPPATQKDDKVSAEIPVSDWVGREVFIAVKITGDNSRSMGWSNFAVLQVVPPVGQPVALKAENVPAGVQLSWQSKAASHRIFRSKADEPFAQIATTPQSPWVDTTTTPGVEYRYQVQAVNPAGDKEAESPLSQVVSLTVKDVAPPAVPASLRAVAGLGTLEVAWDANREPDVAGYRLFRSTGAEWTRVAELSGPAYTDRDIKPGSVYRYAVSAYDSNGNESARSAPVEITAP
jgi:hypothetical protein